MEWLRRIWGRPTQESFGFEPSHVRIARRTWRGVVSAVHAIGPVSKGVLELTTIGVAMLFAFEISSSIRQDVVVLEDFASPPSLQAKGYTADVLTSRLIDTINSMHDLSDHPQGAGAIDPILRPVFLQGSRSEALIVETTKGPFSLKWLVRRLQGLLDRKPIYVRGQITEQARGFHVSIQLTDRSGLEKRRSFTVGDLERSWDQEPMALVRIAEFVLETADPFSRIFNYAASNKMERAWYTVSSISDPAEKFGTATFLAWFEWMREGSRRPLSAWEINRAKSLAGDLKDPASRDFANRFLEVWMTLSEKRYRQAHEQIDKLLQYWRARDRRDFDKDGKGEALRWSLHGVVWNLQGDTKQYENSVRKAAEAAPKDASHLRSLAAMEVLNGRYAAAEMLFDRLTKMNACDVDALLEWGDSLKSQNRNDEAEARYQAALICDPKYSQVWSNLGDLYAEQKKPVAAERAFRMAVEVNPVNEFSHLLFGHFLFGQHRYAEAAAAFQAATNLSPRYEAVYESQIRALEKVRMYEEAIDSCRRWERVAIDPAQPKREMLRLLRTSSGDLQARGETKLALKRSEEAKQLEAQIAEEKLDLTPTGRPTSEQNGDSPTRSPIP